MSAAMRALSPTTSTSFVTIVPLNFASIRTVPAKVSFPSNSAPAPRRRSPEPPAGDTGSLRLEMDMGLPSGRCSSSLLFQNAIGPLTAGVESPARREGGHRAPRGARLAGAIALLLEPVDPAQRLGEVEVPGAAIREERVEPSNPLLQLLERVVHRLLLGAAVDGVGLRVAASNRKASTSTKSFAARARSGSRRCVENARSAE